MEYKSGMGRRHGNNATNSAVYTYAERQLDKKEGSYGLQSRRVGADSITSVDCCALSLQPCINPVVTPGGFIYEKEAILENLLSQKREAKRQEKEYERQLTRRSDELTELARAEQEGKVLAFQRAERGICSQVSNPFKAGAAAAAAEAPKVKAEPLKTAQGDKVAVLPSFWVPSNTPEAKASLPVKPDGKTRCPMSNKPLSIRDLVDVHFALADAHSDAAVISREERFMCPLTQTVLRNSTACVVLRPSGRVITIEAYERLVKPDMVDPISGEKLARSDIIAVHSSGTGFAGGGGKLVATVKKASMMAG